MRLLKLSKLRRYRPSPPPQLHHFVSHYSSYSSHSLLTSSIHHHNRDWRRDNIPGCSWELLRHSTPDCLSFHRRFSAETGVYQPAGPLIPAGAAELGEPFAAVQTIISMLDHYHDVSGFTWWIVISTSTLAMRLALFPVTVLQLRKMGIIGKVQPRIPFPVPWPTTHRSFGEQFAIYLKYKKETGCPSLLWFGSMFALQVPCFFLFVNSVRRMCLLHHPGFDTGGTLWFQNLTECTQGELGYIFPVAIAALHCINVQLSFKTVPIRNTGLLGKLAKVYKYCLTFMTLPIFFSTFFVPQGGLIYWLSNSTLTLIQGSILRNPAVRKYFGLPIAITSAAPEFLKNYDTSTLAKTGLQLEGGVVPAQCFSPIELVQYSVQFSSQGDRDFAIRLLRVALVKDPLFVKAMFAIGQMMAQSNQSVEAAEHLETAISTLLEDSLLTELEGEDLFNLLHLWAGIAYVQQGKMEQALVHLDKMKVPKDLEYKDHYYGALVFLSRALVEVDRADQALEWLQTAAAYNPAFTVYIAQLERDLKKLSTDSSEITIRKRRKKSSTGRK